MEKTTIYLVRHGETDYNRNGIVQGRLIDSDLNETGRIQAEAVGNRLAEISIDALYSSPLKRARQTTEAIAVHHSDVPVYERTELEEMCWGVLEGRPINGSSKNELERIYQIWDDGDFSFSVERGESILDVRERGLRVIKEILTHHQGGTVMIVTHGRFLRVLLATVLEGIGLKHMNDIAHTNTGVNRLTYTGGEFRADFINCTDHLAGIETA